jgi:hypothetical protein
MGELDVTAERIACKRVTRLTRRQTVVVAYATVIGEFLVALVRERHGVHFAYC